MAYIFDDWKEVLDKFQSSTAELMHMLGLDAKGIAATLKKLLD